MREIKFRTWDKEEKRWCQASMRENGIIFNPSEPNTWKSIPILQQFTGLKDVNEKEVYEGDIVKDYKGNTYFVMWDNIKGCWDMKYTHHDLTYNSPCDDKNFYDIEKFDTIGNIYENPDLLRGNNA